MPITRESLIDHLFNSHPGQVEAKDLLLIFE